MQQILSDKKRYLTRDAVCRLDFPQTPEVSIARLWWIVEQHSVVRAYLPESWTRPDKADRAFVISILCTLLTDYMRELARDVRAQRAALRA